MRHWVCNTSQPRQTKGQPAPSLKGSLHSSATNSSLKAGTRWYTPSQALSSPGEGPQVGKPIAEHTSWLLLQTYKVGLQLHFVSEMK